MPPQLRPDIASTATDDGLVLLDERSGRYWQLNATGTHVLQALLAGQPGQDIAAELATRHGIDLAQATRDVTAVIDQLHSAKLLNPR